MALDALGNSIVIGNAYGYSTSDGGWSKTTIGIAVRISESGKVTMGNNIVKRYLYGKTDDSEWNNPVSPGSSIKPHHLFPVDMEHYKKRYNQ